MKTKEILFMIIVVAVYARNPYASTHNNLFILESCIPYRIHILNVTAEVCFVSNRNADRNQVADVYVPPKMERI